MQTTGGESRHQRQHHQSIQNYRKSAKFEDFEDFMKSDGTIITGTPPHSGQGEFFASETCVSEVFEKV